MKQLFTVYSAENGFIIERPSMDEEEYPGKVYSVFEVPNTIRRDVEELKSLRSLAYEILDLLGYSGSKHDVYRLRVVIEKQQLDLPQEEALSAVPVEKDQSAIIEIY